MTEDIEITYARRLGDVLGEMRDALDEEAMRRVLTFILSRYGVTTSGLYILTLPQKPKIALPPVVDAPAPMVEEPPNGHEAGAPPHLAEVTEREMRGAQLRAARTAARLSQNSLGRHVGLHQADISAIELGRTTVSEERWALIWKAVEVAS